MSRSKSRGHSEKNEIAKEAEEEEEDEEEEEEEERGRGGRKNAEIEGATAKAMCVGSAQGCRVTNEIVVPFCLHYCRGCAPAGCGYKEAQACPMQTRVLRTPIATPM